MTKTIIWRQRRRRKIRDDLRCACITITLFGIGMMLIALKLSVVLASDQETDIAPEYIGYIEEISEEYCVAPELIEALIEAESGGDANAVSVHGAVGLMQVVPAYNTERMEKLGVTDLFDPYSNILVGTDLLMEYAQKYEDLPTALMCYNEGEYYGAINRSNDWNISEYARKIIRRSDYLQKLHDAKG